MSVHRLHRLATLMILAALLVGCVAPTPAPQPTAEPLILTDSRGQDVEIPRDVKRIVSLAPSNTEVLFALGLGDRVVGVTKFCDYPPEAQEIEKIGDMMPNLEKIVALNPDLVLGITGAEEAVTKLEELGIAVLILNPSDLEGIWADIRMVGKAAGAEEEAKELASELKGRVERVTERVAQVEERPRVFCELDATDPAKPWTAGPGSFIHTLIELAGGQNIAADAPSPWVQFSAEEIIASDPQLIILADANYGMTAESVAQRPGWEVIAAVEERNIHPIDDDLITLPSPRIVDGLEELARMIHPELFEEG